MSVARQLERGKQKSLPIKFLSLEISQSALCAAQMRMKNEKKTGANPHERDAKSRQLATFLIDFGPSVCVLGQGIQQ
jgi:hypothetical protein